MRVLRKLFTLECKNEFNLRAKLALNPFLILKTNSLNRPFSLVHDFVLPIQIMWRYPAQYFLSTLEIFVLACSLFNEHDEGVKPPRYRHCDLVLGKQGLWSCNAIECFICDKRKEIRLTSNLAFFVTLRIIIIIFFVKKENGTEMFALFLVISQNVCFSR